MTASIAFDDALILSHRANPTGSNFRERQVIRVRKKQSSAIIAVDVRRFGHAINTDEVFGTHRAGNHLNEIAPSHAAPAGAQDHSKSYSERGHRAMAAGDGRRKLCHVLSVIHN